MNAFSSQEGRALSALRAIDPGCDRETWVKVLAAAKDAGISFDDASDWSAGAPSYDLKLRTCLDRLQLFKSSSCGFDVELGAQCEMVEFVFDL